MENCGRDCCIDCRKEHEKFKTLMSESKSIEEFLNKVSTGGINYKLKDKNTIIGEYNKCYCSLVKQTKKSLQNKLYCQCGVGHIKVRNSAVTSQPCLSGHITADKRLRYASPKLPSATFLSARCYMKLRTPLLRKKDIYIDLI
jgi:hypothetical protein